MEETTSKAERIRASRGNYEVEVTFTGEAGLHECANLCPKNPGHDNFIPTNDFNIRHLPSRYRDNLLVDTVRAMSDITCRLSVPHLSEDRPQTWPDSDQTFPLSGEKGENFTTVGTGWVSQVFKYTEERNINCECDVCLEPGNTPKKTWGRVYIQTANHVVYNTEEARHTKCQFFYDSHETDIDTVLTLTGGKVHLSNIKGNWCMMGYITHDVELVDRFFEMWRRWDDLRDNVIDEYVSGPGVRYDTNVDHDLCIVVSHPHGCTKVISVGTWTDRQVVKKYGDVSEDITYRYNTPTCPGSSGAPVITLCKDKRWAPGWWSNLPAHSQGGEHNDNDNNSGVGNEYLTNL